jgi:hypothetical protein
MAQIILTRMISRCTRFDSASAVAFFCISLLLFSQKITLSTWCTRTHVHRFEPEYSTSSQILDASLACTAPRLHSFVICSSLSLPYKTDSLELTLFNAIDQDRHHIMVRSDEPRSHLQSLQPRKSRIHIYDSILFDII